MNNQYRKVLYIAYYFPPMGLSGVQRTLKFVKYLPSYGWKPTVLTVGPTAYFASDHSLLAEVEKAGVEVIRTGSFDVNFLLKNRGVVKMPPEWIRKLLQFLGDTFFIPDTKIGWKRKAVKAASALLEKEHFDLIFATAPPQTDFLIGLKLKKRFNLPLVVEYRDAWLNYPFKYYPTPLHRYLHRRLERKVLKAAHHIIVTQRRMKENILKTHQDFSYNDISIISQGYDSEDFEKKKTKPKKSRRMTIAHAGTFYGGRNPKLLIQALHNVTKEDAHLRGRIELLLIGNERAVDKKLVQQLGLQNDVTFTGYVEHKKCTELLQGADVLWFVNDNDLSSPGKLYEYFGTQKPILASIVDSYIKQLVLECNAAYCVPLDDLKAHETALIDLLKKYKLNALPSISNEFAERFNRTALTGELAKIFESTIDIEPHVTISSGNRE